MHVFLVVLGVAAAIPLVFVALVVAFGWLFSGPVWRGPVTDHFDGTRFLNPPGGTTRASVARWITDRDRKRGVWGFIDEPPGPKPPARVGRGEMRVTLVNHATVLVQLDGLNLLTDPVWSNRVSPVQFAGPARHRNPGLRFDDLPKIDLVLLSHNHYDHLDTATLKRLVREHHPRIVTGLGNGAILERLGFPAPVEMDWWDSLELVPGLRITAVPGQHFSSRGLFDRDRTLWCGFVVEGIAAGAFYFAGDTGFGPHFGQIGEKFPGLRLALLPIGAYRPEWFMAPVHIGPRQAIEAHALTGAQTSVAIHYGTWGLGADGQTEPPEVLERALASHAAPRPDFRVLRHGEAVALPPVAQRRSAVS